MIDGYEYQKQKRKEAKELQKKNKKPIEKTDLIMGTFVVSCFLAFVILLVVGIFSEHSSRNECESIGGKYQVIDSKYSVAYKRNVDVYGCVK